MTRLLYIANIRLPTEKAHGLQIVQNCEAFAGAGAQVTLWTARRFNTPAMRAVEDIWAFYGVERCFDVRRLPCLDLLPLVPGRGDWLARLIFYLQQGTFILAALVATLFTRADVIYSRDLPLLWALRWLRPRRQLVYEAHQFQPTRAGRGLQTRVVRQVGTIVTVTRRLGDDLVRLGADPARILAAHDGFRGQRFADLPNQGQARAALGWPAEVFIVGYVGRLQTMTMDKGVGTLVTALRSVPGASLALVGGPDDMAEALRAQWVESGLDGSRFINVGQVPPAQVPLYLSAFDLCALPLPWTEHFAYYASPIKLFEYMAAGRALVASNLPSIAEVVADGESALLVPPGDADALAAAIQRLQADPDLRENLAQRAQARALTHYTWSARARAILAKVAQA